MNRLQKLEAFVREVQTFAYDNNVSVSGKNHLACKIWDLSKKADEVLREEKTADSLLWTNSAPKGPGPFSALGNVSREEINRITKELFDDPEVQAKIEERVKAYKSK